MLKNMKFYLFLFTFILYVFCLHVCKVVEYILLRCWPKGSHGCFAKTVDCSPQTNSKAVLMKTMPTQFIEGTELVLHRAFTHMF